MVKDIGTETKILEAARRVFLEKGMAGARMQEIADEAGINKALLHYYFRSKEKLFERIFDEIVVRISGSLHRIFSEDMGVLQRLNSIVDVYIDTLLENRYIPLFVLNELNQSPERISNLFEEHMVVHLGRLFDQIQEESEAGIIRPVPAPHLLLNVLGMVIFPFAAYPVISRIASEEMKPFLNNFLSDRKQYVKQFITDALTPK